jgi:DNA modification methylase
VAGVSVVTVHGTDRFAAFHGDTVDVARAMPDSSVDFSVFSPPFASLYTYSNSPRDMGNVRSDEEFFAHYKFLIRESFRIMAPGRNVSIHCMLMPTTIQRDGYIGLRDFRGDIIRAYESCQLESPCADSLQVKGRGRCEHSFVFHSEVVIWKDPVTAMQRTHALGLLHKTLLTDSSRSRQGIPDYVVTMRKPGKNEKPITHWATRNGDTVGDPAGEEFQVERWQRYASPIWTDIDPSDTLQGYRQAKEEPDEKHICPLQLGVIRRCIELWSRPDDVVWSPFMGIGSEGFVALQEGRRFVGAELKTSYYEQAVANLREAATVRQHDLFAGVDVPATP